RRLKLWACYGVLGAAHLVPSRWLEDGPLIEPLSLERVRETFAEDWAACLAYAEANNPAPLTP
ncbi:MAG: hypothetical protein EBU28_12240, partial [Gammaproteobacteria bacterium]|nr:hypothetical protein [Gammaproteobacteria bacterium]